MARPWDRLHPKDYARLQEALLGDLIRRYVYPFSPYYRRLFDDHGIRPGRITRLQDLEQIPLTSRADFEATSEDGWRPFRAMLRPSERSLRRWAHRAVLRRVAREKLLRGDLAAERLLAEEFKPIHLHLPEEGGPIVGYTMRDLSGLSQAGARSLAVMGATRADVLVSTLPYGPSLPFWYAYYAAQGGGLASLHLGAGEVIRPARAAHWLQRAGGTVFMTQPGYAEGFLRGAPPAVFARLRTLALWSDTGMDGARERLTTRLRTSGAPDAVVTTVLGVPEARVAWVECPPPIGQPESAAGYHTYPDLELIEVVDPDTGESLGEEQPGEIVYTSLDWRGSALLRFRTGVVARNGVTHQRCPGCGRSVPRILPALSRIGWQVRVVGSRGEVDVDLADVIPVLWRARGVPLWQLDVAKGGGPRGTDMVYAYLGGTAKKDAMDLQQVLAPFGVRCRRVELRQLGRRVGLGRERPEERVIVRTVPTRPEPEPVSEPPPEPRPEPVSEPRPEPVSEPRPEPVSEPPPEPVSEPPPEPPRPSPFDALAEPPPEGEDPLRSFLDEPREDDEEG